jgi:hypothetical protein
VDRAQICESVPDPLTDGRVEISSLVKPDSECHQRVP